MRGFACGYHTALIFTLALGGAVAPSLAGEPPFPNELLYPNVVPPTRQFGTYGQGLGAFSEPTGACFLSPDRLAIVDTGNRRVQVVSIDGEGLYDFGEKTEGADGKPSSFVSPTAIACDEKTIAIADAGSSEVHLFDKAGRLLKTLGGFGTQAGRLNEPSGIAIGDDVIAVSDTGNNRVQVFDREGRLKAAFGAYGTGQAQLNRPLGIAVDGSGDIYVADSLNNRIQKFNASGSLLKSWGDWGSHAGFFATPSSVTSRGQHVYVTDLTNHRIQVFDRHGNFLFQWGRHPVRGHEGQGRTHYPWALAVNEDESKFALVEPVENRLQIFEKVELAKTKNVNDSAWWDKATRFHYGSRPEIGGNLMAISEPDTHSVLVFDISNDVPTLVSRLGGRGSSLGKLIEPSGMVVNESKGEILVTDAGNLRLQTLGLVKAPSAELAGVSTPLGYLTDLGRAVKATHTAFLGVPVSDGKVNVEKVEKFAAISSARPLTVELKSAERVIYPGALKRAPDGELYLYDQGQARILVLRDGVVRTSFGGYGTEPGKFRSVHNMSFSKDGKRLFVVDPYNFRVQILDRDGIFISAFGRPGHADEEFSSIFGITSGLDGFIYITDETKHCIYKYTEEGKFVARWSRWGTEPGELYKPKGIAQDARGRLYLLSFGNHRGEIYSTEGKHLGSFGLADPDTSRGKEVMEILTSRPAYAVSAKSMLQRDVSSLLNATRVSKATAAALQMTSNADNYVVRVSSSQPLSSMDATKTLLVSVARKVDGKPIDVELEFSASMPAHNHGLLDRPQVKKTGAGKFEIAGVTTPMEGLWELYFDIHNRLENERAQAAIFVR